MIQKWLTMPSTWKGMALLASGAVDYLSSQPTWSPYVAAFLGVWETFRNERRL